MPTALPGLSAAKASELLQISNRMIKTVPEVEHVMGKAGRAETATDPAPLAMFETSFKLKPREQWRAGMTPEKLVETLDAAVQVPGLVNVWIPPIRNRLDMLATGIKSPLGVKVSGSDLAAIEPVAPQVEQLAKTVPGVSSALAEHLTGGRFIDIDIDRAAAARWGLSVADVQSLLASAVGATTWPRSLRAARVSLSTCAKHVHGATRRHAWPLCPCPHPAANKSRRAWWPRQRTLEAGGAGDVVHELRAALSQLWPRE